MKNALNLAFARRRPTAARAFSSQSRSRIVGLWLAALLLLGSVALPPAALAFKVLGTGESALLGSDLTDPENNGDPENNTNYNATFDASEEAGFGGDEAAFNVFDNQVDNGGNDKWCCGDSGNFPTQPLFIDATFAAPIVLRRFTITSGNDASERDPLVWKIQGSNDGTNFTDIFVRNNPTSIWTARKQVIEFNVGPDFAEPAAYSTIRFICSDTDSLFQLSELEYFDTPALIVTTTADDDNGATNGMSLREALGLAAAAATPQTITFSDSTDGGAVNFHDGTARTITLGGTALTIASDVTITGPGAKLLAVSGNNVSRVFAVSAGKTATLAELTIKNGNGSQGGVPRDGGGIYNGGTLAIQNCTISDNSALFNGGGVFNENNATLTIQNSTVSGNRVTSSGRNGGGISNGSPAMLTIQNSTIAGNSTANGPGGGISSGGTVVVQNSSITGNTAGGNGLGGGVNSQSTFSLVLENSIVAGNIGSSGSPDIYAAGGAPDITSNGYNFIGDTTGISGGVQAGDKTFTSTMTTLADLLETAAGAPVLKDNGGATFTVKVVPGSPALDAGDPNFDPTSFSPALTTDQRGAPFERVVRGKPASADPIVDIGAFEVQLITLAPGVAANGLNLDVADAPLDLTGPIIGAMPPGGTFSGPGVDANGVFHPELLDPGTYTITYETTTPDEYGNTGSASFEITITADNPYVRIVATVGPGGTGIDVPGEPAGTKFTQLGLASMDSTSNMMFGDLRLVCARVRIKPAGGAEVPAIYQGTSNTASSSFLGTPPIAPGGILVRGGDAAPDGNGGTHGTFASFQEPVFGNGYVAFGATITGAGVTKTSDTGLWSTRTGQLDLVVAEGGTATDSDGNPMPGVLFEKIQSYALSADGEAVSFVATLKGAGVKGTNKTGVWQYRTRFDFMSNPLPPLTKQIFRTGDLFNVTVDFNDPNNLFDDDFADRPVKSLKLFIPAKTIPGQRRSYASSNGYLFAFAKFAAGRDAVLGWIDNGFFFFFRSLRLENTTVGHPGVPSINSNGNFAMRAGLSIGAVLANNPNVKITAKNDQTILTGSSQFNIGILSQEGSPVSSTNPEIFTTFDEPAYNDNFNTAFFAKVKAPGLPASQQRVLIYDAGPLTNFEPAVIARTGTQAAGFHSVLWKDFTAMVLPDSNYGPVFLAKLSGPGVTPKNNIGLWATDTDGTVRLLLRTGNAVSVNGVDKTVSLINTLGAALDSPGQGRYVDLLGNVSATLTFTDGTTALVHFGMPTSGP